MKIKILYSLLFILTVLNCFSQDISKSASSLKKAAIDYEEIGDIYSAIDYYSKYLEKRPENAYYTFRLAGLYQQIRDYTNAEKYYKQAYILKKEKDAVAFYHYARMQKINGKYEDAEANLTKARKKLKSNGKQGELRKMAKSEIEGCQMALKLKEMPLNIDIVRLNENVNNQHIDFSPFPINDSSFYYASVVSEKAAQVINFVENKPIYSKFYRGIKNGEIFKGRIEVKEPFNLVGKDVGNGAICPHGNRIYFTVCKKTEVYENHCEIYFSELINNKWSVPESVGKVVNNPRYTTTQPTVGIESRQNREVLYFVSDRPGGRGGLDIWYSIYDQKSNSYLEPKNLSGKINTEGDETTPFYNQTTRKLYFSSDGHPGLGGLDVFKSNGELKKFEQPVNIGYPLNSNADELYYVLNPNQSSGYFVSNRKGALILDNISCCDDIFYFKIKDYIDIIANGKIVEMHDSSSLQYIENIISSSGDLTIENAHFLDKAIVSLWLISTKTPSEKFIVKIDSTGTDGSYNFNLEAENNYLITVEKDGYYRRQKEITTKGITFNDTITNNFFVYKISERPLIIRNIYYPFDKYYLTDTAKAIIDSTIYELMKENPQIIAEISSHTDSKGTDDYNIRLSQKRAQSVVDYLVSKGISKERLQAKGYGETKPIAPNENKDKTDNPEGRQKNRRTEFRVIGLLPQYTEIKYEE